MDTSEYGFGFWLRYLTRYPTEMFKGLEDPWYFIARLTKNNPTGNNNFGDRMLAIWQGLGKQSANLPIFF